MSQVLSPDKSLDDFDLERRVMNYLANQGVWCVDQIEVTAHQGVVTIGGLVQNDHEKWLGAECGRRGAGVVHLIDHLEVVEPLPTPARGRLGNSRPAWQSNRPADGPTERNDPYGINEDRLSPDSRRHF